MQFPAAPPALTRLHDHRRAPEIGSDQVNLGNFSIVHACGTPRICTSAREGNDPGQDDNQPPAAPVTLPVTAPDRWSAPHA
jgi:hypothetical protein